MPVPDHAVVPFMVTLHRALAGGAALSQATAVARAGIDPAHGADLAIGAAFTCFG